MSAIKPSFFKNNFNLLLLIAVFCFSRVFYLSYFGLRFDTSPLPSFCQYIDIDLLKHHLLQSLYYLHSQPPGFNLFLGVILKLFPNDYPAAFSFIYMAFGLIFSISLYLVMTEIGINSLLGLLLTSLYMISPIVFEYENWLFYEYPSAALLSLALLFLNRFALRETQADCFKFFLLLALIIYIRGLFSIYWFISVIAILLVLKTREWKKIILSCLIPAILIFALYFKNLLVFNSFSINDAQIGMNLAQTAIGSLPEHELNALVAQKKISGLYTTPPFYHNLSIYLPYGIQIKKTGVPVLDQRKKASLSPNANNLVYLEVGKREIKDASYVLKHYPRQIFTNLGLILYENYFYPADQCDYFYNGNDSLQWIKWDGFFKDLFFARFLGKNFLPYGKVYNYGSLKF